MILHRLHTRFDCADILVDGGVAVNVSLPPVNHAQTILSGTIDVCMYL